MPLGWDQRKGSWGWGGRSSVHSSRSFLSVVGTWYVTAIVIIKYIWPDKEMTPGDILTRWVRTPTRHVG